MGNNDINTRIVKKKKKRKLRKRAYILIPLFIVFIGALSWAISLYIKADSVLTDSYEDDGRDKSELRAEKVDPKFDNVSILMMGVDDNDHRTGNARTDSLMVATLNKDEKSVKLVNIPRDSYVYVPAYGYETKINHAHAKGGPKATIETVENLLEVPIDYYVKVNFHAFVEVVDALGGITAEVPYEFKESNSMDKRDAIHLMPGEQKLNGEEALALARTRKLDNDIERGKRQQDLIKAIVKKATSVNALLKFDDVIEAIGDNMTTNMTFSEMKSFISYGTSGSNIDIDSSTLSGVDYQPANVYYWQLDQQALTETKTMLQSHLELQTELTDSPSSTTPSDPTYETEQERSEVDTYNTN